MHTQGKNTWSYHVSSEHVLTPRPAAMIATLRRRPAACRVVDGVEDLGAAVPRAVPSGGSGHSPPEEQPARRKRRNSLMAVKQNPEINRADVCLAGSIKDNTCQSHNEPKCSGPAQEPQRHRSATRRCPG